MTSYQLTFWFYVSVWFNAKHCGRCLLMVVSFLLPSQVSASILPDLSSELSRVVQGIETRLLSEIAQPTDNVVVFVDHDTFAVRTGAIRLVSVDDNSVSVDLHLRGESLTFWSWKSEIGDGAWRVEWTNVAGDLTYRSRKFRINSYPVEIAIRFNERWLREDAIDVVVWSESHQSSIWRTVGNWIPRSAIVKYEHGGIYSLNRPMIQNAIARCSQFPEESSLIVLAANKHAEFPTESHLDHLYQCARRSDFIYIPYEFIASNLQDIESAQLGKFILLDAEKSFRLGDYAAVVDSLRSLSPLNSIIHEIHRLDLLSRAYGALDRDKIALELLSRGPHRLASLSSVDSPEHFFRLQVLRMNWARLEWLFGDRALALSVFNEIGLLSSDERLIQELSALANIQLANHLLELGQGDAAVKVLARVANASSQKSLALLYLGRAWLAPAGDKDFLVAVGTRYPDEQGLSSAKQALISKQRTGLISCTQLKAALDGNPDLCIENVSRINIEREGKTNEELAIRAWAESLMDQDTDLPDLARMAEIVSALSTLGRKDLAERYAEHALNAMASVWEAHKAEVSWLRSDWLPALFSQLDGRYELNLDELLASTEFQDAVLTNQMAKRAFLQWFARQDTYSLSDMWRTAGYWKTQALPSEADQLTALRHKVAKRFEDAIAGYIVSREADLTRMELAIRERYATVLD